MKVLYVLFLILVSVTYGCVERKEERTIRIMVDGDSMTNVDYQRTYVKALEGDTLYIKKMALAEPYRSGFEYIHGVILFRLINIIGDKKFTNALKEINDDEKKHIVESIKCAWVFNRLYPNDSIMSDYTSINDYWNRHPLLKKKLLDSNYE